MVMLDSDDIVVVVVDIFVGFRSFRGSSKAQVTGDVVAVSRPHRLFCTLYLFTHVGGLWKKGVGAVAFVGLLGQRHV